MNTYAIAYGFHQLACLNTSLLAIFFFMICTFDLTKSHNAKICLHLAHRNFLVVPL